MKTLNKIIHTVVKLFVVILTATTIVRAEAPVITGFIDTTYNYNFNDPADQANRYRSFDTTANTFALQSAHLNFSGTLGDAGYVIKVIGGTDASALSGATDVWFQEAFMTYLCPMTKLNFKIGKFATTEGIEVIESKDDPTITRGFLFGLAEPYLHTGALVTRAFGRLELGAGLVNGWDNHVDNNEDKTILGKIGLNLGDPFALTISGTTGDERGDAGVKRNSIDAVLVSKIIPRVVLNFQANYGDEHVFDAGGNNMLDTWSGVGFQPVINFTDKFFVGGRVEYFENAMLTRTDNTFSGVAVAEANQALTNFTITPGYKMTDNMTMRLEYRYDTSNRKDFIDDQNTAKDNQSTVTAQWLLTF